MMPFGSSMRTGLVLLALLNMLPALEPDGSWWILVIAVASAILSGLSHRRVRRPDSLRWLVRVAVLASVGYLLYEMFAPQTEQTIYILDLGHFIIFLTCCKFFEMHTHRDMGLIVLMAFLLMIIGAFVSASPLFGVVLVIDITFGLAWLTTFQTRREIDQLVQRRSRELPATRATSYHAELIGGAPPFARSLRATLLLSIALVAFSVICFVAIPRAWGRGILGRMNRFVPASATGFTEEIQLRDAPIVQDETLVMRVRLLRNGKPITGEEAAPYLRGATFDRYRNGRWQRSSAGSAGALPVRSSQRIVPLYPEIDPKSVDAFTIEQQIWLESLGTGALFSMYRPVAIASSDLRRVMPGAADATLHTDDPPRGAVAYQVFSCVSEAVNFGREVPPPRPRTGGIDKIVRAFARGYFNESGEPIGPERHEDLATVICGFLRSGSFQYTLDRGTGPRVTDPMRDFLFDNPRGHCEFFASAMAGLCMSLNIPARVVSGFYGGEYNEVGGFFQFRRKDAHAWVEVYLPGRGWVTFDPSPPSPERRVQGGRGLGHAVSSFVDFLRFKWATLVVAFDTRSRGDLARWFEQWVREAQETREGTGSLLAVLRAFLWGPEMLQRWERILYWLLLVLVAVFAVLAFRVLWILSIMLQEYVMIRGKGDKAVVRKPEARFYDRLLLLLSHKGYVKPRQSTPREFALELARARREFADLPQFTEWFYEVQYGGGTLGRQRWKRLEDFLRRMREDPAFGAR